MTADIDGFPIYKGCSHWTCDGPNGRFTAKTKRDLIALLRETGGLYRHDGEYHEIVTRYYAKAAQSDGRITPNEGGGSVEA